MLYPYYLLPITYYLLPITYYLLPVPCSLFPIYKKLKRSPLLKNSDRCFSST
ncbi:hypothetical protein [Planktothrix agardhii]|uniref:hypothetical protein n=1 Tax=Planktothrix agardhii TaxID=1160 RepID=UPI0020B202B1|nr:hypothetical protein [Planktothrix agardhii]